METETKRQGNIVLDKRALQVDAGMYLCRQGYSAEQVCWVLEITGIAAEMLRQQYSDWCRECQ